MAQALNEIIAILVVIKDLFALNTTHNNVVKCCRCVNAGLSGHGLNTIKSTSGRPPYVH
jgi:hypothetical protein